MQHAVKEMGKKRTVFFLWAFSPSEFRQQVPSLLHITSIEIKDIWFLLPYLKEKFSDKEVSTLMIKPYLD